MFSGGTELIPWPLDDRKYENLTGGFVMALALGCYNESHLPLSEGETSWKEWSDGQPNRSALALGTIKRDSRGKSLSLGFGAPIFYKI